MSTLYNPIYQTSVSTVQTDTMVPAAGSFNFFRWSAGAALSTGSAKIELFWDANGTQTDMTLVDAIYTASETYNHELDPNNLYTADGTTEHVVIRRTVLGSTDAREIYASWQGSIL
jgi:hypothetical protein